MTFCPRPCGVVSNTTISERDRTGVGDHRGRSSPPHHSHLSGLVHLRLSPWEHRSGVLLDFEHRRPMVDRALSLHDVPLSDGNLGAHLAAASRRPLFRPSAVAHSSAAKGQWPIGVSSSCEARDEEARRDTCVQHLAGRSTGDLKIDPENISTCLVAADHGHLLHNVLFCFVRTTALPSHAYRGPGCMHVIF